MPMDFCINRSMCGNCKFMLSNVWISPVFSIRRRLRHSCFGNPCSRPCDRRSIECFFCCCRGRNASRLVQCFSNAPDELALSPSNAFALAANGLHEMHLLVHPARPGFRTYTVNGVDVENHQVVDTWMIKVDTRMPVVSKQFGEQRVESINGN